MSLEESREILLHVLERNPTVMIDIMRPANRQPGGYHPGPDVQAPDWCVCTKCREMPTEIEKVCCGKENCISLVPVSNIYAYQILFGYFKTLIGII